MSELRPMMESYMKSQDSFLISPDIHFYNMKTGNVMGGAWVDLLHQFQLCLDREVVALFLRIVGFCFLSVFMGI
jgi:hypothetical protein